MVALGCFCWILFRNPHNLSLQDLEISTPKFRSFISEEFEKKSDFGFPVPDQKMFKRLEQMTLFQDISGINTSKHKIDWMSPEKRNSLSYMHHLELMRSEQKKAMAYLKQYTIAGIIWSPVPQKCLVILKNKNNKIFLRQSDKIKDWVLVKIHKTSIDFEYNKNTRILKKLSVQT